MSSLSFFLVCRTKCTRMHTCVTEGTRRKKLFFSSRAAALVSLTRVANWRKKRDCSQSMSPLLAKTSAEGEKLRFYNQDCTVFLQKLLVAMLSWLHSFRITTFEDFVLLVGKPYMWAQRIGGLDFLPEESHVRQTQCLYFRLCSFVIWVDLSLIVVRAFNWSSSGIIQPNQSKSVEKSD